MDSLFFNITDTRYKVSPFFDDKNSTLTRIDISNGVVFLEGTLSSKGGVVQLKNLDAMVMIVMCRKNNIKITNHINDEDFLLQEGEIGIFCSSKQDITMMPNQQENTEVFILFIADFFLKRYVSGLEGEPIDLLYQKIQKDISLDLIAIQPIDALSLYIVEKLLSVSQSASMKSIRAQQHIIEFMIHRFSLMDIVEKEVCSDELALAARAKSILLEDFITPPSIESIAHRCATNSSKLKKVFKKVYKTTLYAYVQKLRLEEANMLLKEEQLSIGEIAKRVGYKHQGHFSKLFFKTYGVYPKELAKR